MKNNQSLTPDQLKAHHLGSLNSIIKKVEEKNKLKKVTNYQISKLDNANEACHNADYISDEEYYLNAEQIVLAQTSGLSEEEHLIASSRQVKIYQRVFEPELETIRNISEKNYPVTSSDDLHDEINDDHKSTHNAVNTYKRNGGSKFFYQLLQEASFKLLTNESKMIDDSNKDKKEIPPFKDFFNGQIAELVARANKGENLAQKNLQKLAAMTAFVQRNEGDVSSLKKQNKISKVDFITSRKIKKFNSHMAELDASGEEIGSSVLDATFKSVRDVFTAGVLTPDEFENQVNELLKHPIVIASMSDDLAETANKIRAITMKLVANEKVVNEIDLPKIIHNYLDRKMQLGVSEELTPEMLYETYDAYLEGYQNDVVEAEQFHDDVNELLQHKGANSTQLSRDAVDEIKNVATKHHYNHQKSKVENAEALTPAHIWMAYQASAEAFKAGVIDDEAFENDVHDFASNKKVVCEHQRARMHLIKVVKEIDHDSMLVRAEKANDPDFDTMVDHFKSERAKLVSVKGSVQVDLPNYSFQGQERHYRR